MRTFQQLKESMTILHLKEEEGEKKDSVPKGFEKFFKKKEEEK